MSKEYLVEIDKHSIVVNKTIYYDKLFELGKKISQITNCHDLDAEKIYHVDGKYYMSITASEKCLQDLVHNRIIDSLNYPDILGEDKLYEILQKSGLEEIPDEDIYEFRDAMRVAVSHPQDENSCILS